jgi:hypothetical protein
MANINTPSTIKDMPLAIITNMIALATSGFGVVVGLAWNEVISTSVKQYIDPYLGKNSGVVSLLIYATVMTVLAVLVTMQLTSIQRSLENVQTKLIQRTIAKKADNKKKKIK